MVSGLRTQLAHDFFPDKRNELDNRLDSLETELREASFSFGNLLSKSEQWTDFRKTNDLAPENKRWRIATLLPFAYS